MGKLWASGGLARDTRAQAGAGWLQTRDAGQQVVELDHVVDLVAVLLPPKYEPLVPQLLRGPPRAHALAYELPALAMVSL